MTRIEYEKKTVEKMIRLYCRLNKHNDCGLCDDCSLLLDYAHRSLDRCRFGNEKSSCSKCPIHCYKPDMKEKIRTVMRFSGPRMILYHPIMAIKHLASERK